MGEFGIGTGLENGLRRHRACPGGANVFALLAGRCARFGLAAPTPGASGRRDRFKGSRGGSAETCFHRGKLGGVLKDGWLLG